MNGGDCYVVAAKLAIDNPEFVLCHGTAHGTGGDALGLDFDHAWCEVEIAGVWFVVDKSNGRDHLGPREPYYEAGTIRGVQRYEHATVLTMVLAHRHYGPYL